MKLFIMLKAYNL